MKTIIALLSLLSLTACYTTQQIKQGTLIPENTGVVAINLICADTVFNVSAYKSGTKMSYGTVPMFENEKLILCNKGYQTFNLPEGQYFLSSIVVRPETGLFRSVHNRHLPENQALKFSVPKGKITYIGDIYYAAGKFPFDLERVVIGTTNVDVMYSVKNNEQGAKSFLQTQNADLLKKLPFSTSLAKQ